MPRKTKTKTKIAAAAPLPPPSGPIENAASPQSKREELLKKCRAARQTARAKGLPPPRTKNTDAAAPAGGAGAAAAGNGGGLPIPISDEERKEKELLDMNRELNEICGGDIEEFLQRQGIDARAFPAIRNSVSRLEKGEGLEKTLVDTMKALHLAATS